MFARAFARADSLLLEEDDESSHYCALNSACIWTGIFKKLFEQCRQIVG